MPQCIHARRASLPTRQSRTAATALISAAVADIAEVIVSGRYENIKWGRSVFCSGKLLRQVMVPVTLLDSDDAEVCVQCFRFLAGVGLIDVDVCD